MADRSRSSKVLYNMKVGLLIQILTPLISFVSRTVFVLTLGEQYLGVNGLYSNILSVLSLADLGLYTVMIYMLYRPIAEKNESAIASLVRFFKKIYLYIALAILAIGMLLVPFLHYIVRESALELAELKLYFVLFLVNTVCSYFMVYKTTLLKADQRMYVTKLTEFFATILLGILQITILLVTKNYVFYLTLSIVVTLVKNVATSKIADKIYPFLKTKSIEKVGSETRKKIVEDIKATFLYKVGTTVMNSTDNILISVLLGVVVVGRYSNYLTIVSLVNAVVMLFSESLLASIGDHNVNAAPNEKFLLFKKVMLLYFGVATFCACCFCSMFNDFMQIWVGGISQEYVLSHFVVYAIAFNFFIGCVSSPIWLFREATGVFRQVKYSMLCAAVLNIGLSIVLCNWIGLPGIILATAISKLCTNFWYDPRVLCNAVFEIKQWAYWRYVLALLLVATPCLVISAALGRMLPGAILGMILKILISFILVLFIFTAFLGRTKEYRGLKRKAFSKFKKSEDT